MARRISLMPADSLAALTAAVNHSPECVAVISDSQLSILAGEADAGTGVSFTARVCQELLLRAWLYHGDHAEEMVRLLEKVASSFLLDAFRREALPCRPRMETPNHELAFPQRTDEVIWHRFCEKVSDYLLCDGLLTVPFDGDRDGAIAIPFKLRPDALGTEGAYDLTGRGVASLTEEGDSVEPKRAGLSIQMLCRLGDMAPDFDGRDFSLAATLAAAMLNGEMPAMPPLTWLAVGVVAGGRVRMADGCAAGLGLARRLGASVVVAPGAGDGDGILSLPPGCSIADAVRLMGQASSSLAPGSLSPLQALDGVRVLDERVHQGALRLHCVRKRLGQFEVSFRKAPESPYSKEGLLRVAVLDAVVDNHGGNPERARAGLDAVIADGSAPATLYCSVLARQVVSLVDLGLLSDADALATQLLVHVQTNPWRLTSCERIRAEMVARGTYGGQVLLVRGLMGEVNPEDSLTELARALELARQSGDAFEICRDDTQIALWYALFRSGSALGVCDATEGRLGMHPLRCQSAALQYLRQHRFLAGYRALLEGRDIPAGFQTWALPDDTVSWLQATALKYRAALHAAVGDCDAAQQDFTESCRLLEADSSPLLRFLGATAALQAGESLLRHGAAHAHAHLDRALAGFRSVGGALDGVHRDPAWLLRVQGLMAGSAAASLPDPRLRYRY